MGTGESITLRFVKSMYAYMNHPHTYIHTHSITTLSLVIEPPAHNILHMCLRIVGIGAHEVDGVLLLGVEGPPQRPVHAQEEVQEGGHIVLGEDAAVGRHLTVANLFESIGNSTRIFTVGAVVGN